MRNLISRSRLHSRQRRGPIRKCRYETLAVETLENRRLLSVTLLQPVASVEHAVYGLADHGRPEVPDQYIVTLKGGVNAENFAAQLRGQGRQVLHVYNNALNGLAFRGPALAHDPRVLRIEPDVVLRTTDHLTPTGVDRIDTDLSPLTNIDDIDGTVADGQRVDVDVAVLDTGVDLDHPDLNVYQTAYFIESSADDGHGHGTHVAGTIGALDNDFGVVGVAPGARIWAVKVLDASGGGTASSIIAGVDYVTAHADEIDVVNMSLAGQGSSVALYEAIQNSVAAGVVYAVAAGNDGADIYGTNFVLDPTANCLLGILCVGTEDIFPASYPEVATIAALVDSDGEQGGLGGSTSYGSDDSFASFSNYSSNMLPDNPVYSPGLGIDLLMPGVDILSTWNDGGYNTLSGTSMATPHAAGLFALYVAQMGRDANGDGTVDAQDISIIRQHLIDSGVSQDSAGGLTTLNDPDGNQEKLGRADLGPALFVTVGNQAITKIAENGGSATATVSRYGDTTNAVTINLAVSDGSSVSLSTTSVTIAAGQRTSESFTITAVDDNVGDRDQVVTITASSSGFRDGIGRVTVLDEESQWADSVIAFSSQWVPEDGSDDWMAVQAVGAPDTFGYGDIPTAYAPSQPDAGVEWITVGFNAPMFASGAVVRETFAIPFVTMIEAREAGTSNFTAVWQGTDDSVPGKPVDFVANWTTTSFAVDALRVTMNTAPGGWEEIDAIALLGGPAVDAPPAAPTGLNALAGNAQVALDWSNNTESDLAGYNVYRSAVSGSGYTQINGPLLTSSDFTDNGVTNGTTYFYLVTAVDAMDQESVNSSEVSATPSVPDTTPPAAPTGVNVIVPISDGGRLDLDWNDSGESDLAGYNVYRSTFSGGTYTLVNTSELVNTSSFTDIALANGTTYFYVVTAVDTSSNESGDSNEDSGTPLNNLIPAAPTNLTATAGNAQVALDWSNNTESDLAGYSSAVSGSGYTQINGPLLTSSDFTDNGVTNGTTYYYVVTAVDTATIPNASTVSNEASATPQELSSNDDLANGESVVSGTIDAGSYGDTHTSDNNYEELREQHSGGRPQNRVSSLELMWTVDVTGGEAVTFYVEAHHTDNSEGDDFVFAYSTDGTNFTDMLTVAKTADNDSYQTFALPDSTQGPVSIRVMDTDRTVGNRGTDTLFVDHLFIRSIGDPPPPEHDVAVTGISAAPNPAMLGQTVVVTVNVANSRDFTETFTVSLAETPGGVDLGSQGITLAAGATGALSFDWVTDLSTATGDHTLTATATTVSGETNTVDNTGATTVTVNEASSGSPNDMYVWDIIWSEKHKGPGGSITDLSFTVEVRRDSDGDATAESSDAVVGAATVTVQLLLDNNDDGLFVDQFWGAVAETTGKGRAAFVLKDAPVGDYLLLAGLEHETFIWNIFLDADNPSFYYDLPNGSETQSAGGSALQSLPATDSSNSASAKVIGESAASNEAFSFTLWVLDDKDANAAPHVVSSDGRPKPTIAKPADEPGPISLNSSTASVLADAVFSALGRRHTPQSLPVDEDLELAFSSIADELLEPIENEFERDLTAAWLG